MQVSTKAFGNIEVSEEKIITFSEGIIGFPDLKGFVLLHNEERGEGAGIRWLQSLEEPAFAIPVMDPLLIKPDYDPEVDDNLLKGIGIEEAEHILVLVSVSVPSDLNKMSVNLQGPFVINIETRQARQIIVDNAQYPVKFPVFDILQNRKEGE